jgi:hypothetical protein
MNEDSRRPLIDIHLFGEKGRGVRARQHIKQGQIIETCPVLIINPNDLEHIKHTNIYNYTFYWPDGRDVISYGYISLANHAEDPNSALDRDTQNQLITWYALRDIEDGEEIAFKYREVPWFRVL